MDLYSWNSRRCGLALLVMLVFAARPRGRSCPPPHPHAVIGAHCQRPTEAFSYFFGRRQSAQAVLWRRREQRVGARGRAWTGRGSAVFFACPDAPPACVGQMNAPPQPKQQLQLQLRSPRPAASTESGRIAGATVFDLTPPPPIPRRKLRVRSPCIRPKDRKRAG